MKPKLSFIIWFSQRTGSTLLCSALESTGIAGRPRELLHHGNEPADLYAKYQVSTPAELQQVLWEKGSSPNGVFGLKYGYYEPFHSKMTNLLKQFPGCSAEASAWEVWQNAFPNCNHIFMTRRNKVRLAVSWWKAIKTEEWHRKTGDTPKTSDLSEGYLFEAIDHLLIEATLREAGTQEFLATGNIIPHTVVYEDFIADYDRTVQGILQFLGITANNPVMLSLPNYEKLADKISEQWVQRYRQERQEGWQNKGW